MVSTDMKNVRHNWAISPSLTAPYCLYLLQHTLKSQVPQVALGRRLKLRGTPCFLCYKPYTSQSPVAWSRKNLQILFKPVKLFHNSLDKKTELWMIGCMSYRNLNQSFNLLFQLITCPFCAKNGKLLKLQIYEKNIQIFSGI